MPPRQQVNFETSALRRVVPRPGRVSGVQWRRAFSLHVETTRLGILGPSTTLCWQGLSRLVKTRPGSMVDTTDLAVSVGQGAILGRNAPISRTLSRMVIFGAALRSGDSLAVGRALPDIPQRMIDRLLDSARLAHHHWASLRQPASAGRQATQPTGVGL
jgi:hypothetical protein